MKFDDKKVGELFSERDRLMDEIKNVEGLVREREDKLEISLKPVKDRIRKLFDKVNEVRFKLYEQGVSAEDC